MEITDNSIERTTILRPHSQKINCSGERSIEKGNEGKEEVVVTLTRGSKAPPTSQVHSLNPKPPLYI